MQFNTNQDFRLCTSLNNLQFTERFIRNKQVVLRSRTLHHARSSHQFSKGVARVDEGNFAAFSCIHQRITQEKYSPGSTYTAMKLITFLEMLGSKLWMKVFLRVQEICAKDIYFSPN